MIAGPAPIQVDRTHTDVQDYWSEYRDLDEKRFRELWMPWFGRERFQLNANDDAPDLYEYLKFLVSVRDGRPVLKFVRANLRAQWLRAHFPDSWIVHITRRPRDVWTSAVGRGSHRVDMNLEPDPTWGAFPTYYSMIADDIGLAVPGHPYRQFYALWLLGERHVGAVADDTWVYEDMVGDFPAWAGSHLIDAGLARSIPTVRVRGDARGAEFHSDEWYDQQEAEVDALLATNFSLTEQLVTDPDQ